MYRMEKCYWCHGVTCHLAKGCFAFASLWLVWDCGSVVVKSRSVYEMIILGRFKYGNRWMSLPERLYLFLFISVILVAYDIGMLITMKWEKRRAYFLLLTAFPIRIPTILTDALMIRINFNAATDSYLILVQTFCIAFSVYYAMVAYSYYLEMLDPPLEEWSESSEESVRPNSYWRRSTDWKVRESDPRRLDPAWAAVLAQRESYVRSHPESRISHGSKKYSRLDSSVIPIQAGMINIQIRRVDVHGSRYPSVLPDLRLLSPPCLMASLRRTSSSVPQPPSQPPLHCLFIAPSHPQAAINTDATQEEGMNVAASVELRRRGGSPVQKTDVGENDGGGGDGGVEEKVDIGE